MTPRDEEIVRWVGRVRIATAAQVAERFGLGRAVTYARLGGLVRLGLVEHARIFHGAPGVYLATRAGLSAVDLALAAARVDLRTYAHDLELNALVIELEREFGRERVITEREMRAADTPFAAAPAARPRFAVALAGPRGQFQVTPAGHPRLHFPDCAVVQAAGGKPPILAVELERTAKGRARLRRILTGYVAARHVRAVRYYVLGDRVAGLVASEVAARRAQGLIEVRAWPGYGRSVLTNGQSPSGRHVSRGQWAYGRDTSAGVCGKTVTGQSDKPRVTREARAERRRSEPSGPSGSDP